MLRVNTAWLIGITFTAVFVILYPIVLAIIAKRRLNVGWRYFGYGALIFFMFQLATRVPLVFVIQSLIAARLKASAGLLWTWLLTLAVTAGLVEEVGRYLGYRWLMRREEKTWNKAIMYGIGHGGLESMLYVGGSLLLTLVNILILPTIDLRALPAPQQAQITQQFAAINAQPAWMSLLGAWERLWTVPFHVALSVIVLQVFRRGRISWLWVAIALHFVVDFSALALRQMFGAGPVTLLVIEGLVALAGLLGIWIIWRLRDRSSASKIDAITVAPEP